MESLNLQRIFIRENIIRYALPIASATLLMTVIIFILGEPFFNTPYLPGNRGSIEYAYLTGVAEKMGFGRPYTFYSLLTHSLALFMDNLLDAAKISALTLLAIYLTSTYLLASLYSSRWIGLLALLSAFLPPVYDTLFKGDYMSLSVITFTAPLLIGLTLLYRESHMRRGMVFASLGVLALPFSDPTLLLMITIAILLSLTTLYMLKRRLLVHVITLGSLLAGTSSLSFTLNASFTDELWKTNPLDHLTSNVVITSALIVAASVGALSLYQVGRKRELSLILVWILVVIVSSPFQPMILVTLIPVLSALSSSPLIYWNEAIKVRKVAKIEETPYYELEIDHTQVLRCITAVMLASLLVLTVPLAIASGNNETQHAHKVKEVEEASKFLKTISRGELIVAHPSIANWLSASSTLKVLPTVNSESFEIADLLTSSSFRVVTQYLKIDDREPFSAARAPLIQIYDGKRYRPFLYIDDSYIKITLRGPEGKDFTESPYKARFLGYRWNETETEILLALRFQSAGLFINKSIVVSKYDAKVKIEYSARVFKQGYKVVSLMLNVYSVVLAELPQLTIEETRGYMKIDEHLFLIDYSGNLVKLSHDKTKDQRFTVGLFQPSTEFTVKGAVTISSPTALSSGRKPWYASFMDLVEKLAVKYVVIPKENRDFLKDALPVDVENLVVKDSFVRYIISSEGKLYHEAPAYALVLNETINPEMREVWYKTAGLNIKKVIRASDSTSVDITYEARPHKRDTYLIASTLSIWIDWNRFVLLFRVDESNKTLKLSLDSATFTIRIKGNVTGVVMELHPEYKQSRILVTYSLNPEAAMFGLSIESNNPLIAKYEPTTRPEMREEDVLTILTEEGFFKPLKELNLYIVFEITPP
ncbi:MAG: hypothetical protein NZ920_05970 [Aigarchaeota archaeon]|nr:hypothetical protein [Aigarchaeota archaeon]MDW8092653.1 hypothetical protein [Nitrososphaerota archaeon]